MIQDIYPHRFSLDYQVCMPQTGDPVIIFEGNQVFLTEDEGYPAYQGKPGTEERYQFLFAIDGQKYFLALGGDVPEKQGLKPCTVRHLRDLRPMHLAFAGYTAWHLYAWYQNNRFCGRCGSKMEPGTDERKLVCTSCHVSVYPRINPCIIVAVHDGDRLLMTRYANRPVTWYVLVAGFIEVGETAEDTVRREVMEETGVKVKNIRYFNSQPWGVPGNLTLGFTAELDGEDQIKVDTGELSEARWFLREEVPVPDDNVSITAALIKAFVHHEF